MLLGVRWLGPLDDGELIVKATVGEGGGVDVFLVETVFDTLNSKAALFALEKCFDEAGRAFHARAAGGAS